MENYKWRGLKGKVAVITDANSGIGLATAKPFAREGAKVFMTGRRQEQFDAAVKEVGHDAAGVTGDVSKMSDLDRLFDIVRREAGRIDVLFANAGGGQFASIENATEEQFDKTFDINVKGTFFTVQKAPPLIKDGGSIILTGSTSTITGIPTFSIYGATKAAVRNFARHWILDLAPRKIRVNVLVPGATSTPGWHAIAETEEQNRRVVAQTEAGTPLGRLEDPDETASAALFLASDESGFVTGSELFVDGGSAQV
jgi:NAD(P)-dependent dehydrogenase (short-subunit alcohol dehydrogenase family)